MDDPPISPDSPTSSRGVIAGSGGHPAFVLDAPQPSAVPVLIAVPHAGRVYPDALTTALRNPQAAALRLEDRYVDRLGQAVAKATGAALLVALAPRAMIDLNRAPDDVDWHMLAAADRPPQASRAPSRRARGGLGLVPRRVPGLGELWNSPLLSDDLTARIEGVHRPYHDALGATLASLRARWGAALLLDLHSMPPVAARPGMQAPQYVIGDRFGASCHGALVAAAFAGLGAQGVAAAHNRPYAGGYTLERHARPDRGVHAFQLEIDRTAYLDSRLRELGEGFDATVGTLIALVRRLGSEVRDLGPDSAGESWSEAAE